MRLRRVRFTRRRRVVERARAGTTPRESRDARRAEIRDAETCWIRSRPSSGGGGVWRWETRERRFRASTRGLNHRRCGVHVTSGTGLSTNQRPGWIRRFFPAKRFVTQESDSTRVFTRAIFFLLLRVFINLVIISLTWAAETETIASVTQRESNRLHDAPLLYTPRTITEASTFPRERQGRRGVREARASRVPPGPLPSSPDGLGPDRGLARRVRRALGS